ncbi:hypothetical protein [Bordetella bronchiseptica]|uniref:hypothetical protein n=1 Tax=Bordetella bronchiseptica TaxID=518 RepID=UPI000FD7ECA4|nr:hypothetical protein [Bordetella bronchiseptica]
MEDSNSRFGAAIRGGLERFCYESRLCGQSAADRTAQPIHEMKVTAEESRLVECWRFAQGDAARQGVDVHTFLMGLGYDKDGELVESLAISPRTRKWLTQRGRHAPQKWKARFRRLDIVDGSIETFPKLFAGLFASYISRDNNILESI